MKHTLLVLTTVLTVWGQTAPQAQNAFDFKILAQPGSIIGGHTLTAETVIESVALNDSGDAAFIARWTDETDIHHAAVFTSRRLVAAEGDLIGGRKLMAIPRQSTVLINAEGQVAFEGAYAGEQASEGTGGEHDGIFVEKHLALTRSSMLTGSPFKLTDDGKIVTNEPERPSAAPKASAPQAKPSLLDRIGIKPPKNIPITIAAARPASQPQPRAPLPHTAEPKAKPPFPTNGHGQILIPVNLSTGFLLLLGTPTVH